jgi:CO/xanthine dehydrogenase FAD-binding subunit
MKSAAFDFRRARSAEEACALLAEHGGDAKLIAGGQSLVPMMAMRLARPAFLVDINDAADLQRIAFDADSVTLGAAVRQRTLEYDAPLAAKLPLLRKALRWVGHAQTRNRGTIGGSIVHADPSAELPLAACVLDATLVLRDASGESEMPAREFIFAPMVTAITPEQCLVAIRFPLWEELRVGCAFDEASLRHGDFAIVAAAAQVALDADGRCVRASLGTASAPVPQAHGEAAGRLVGSRLDDAVIEAAAAEIERTVEPDADLHASAEYRRHLAGVLMRRVLVAARDDAGRGR